MRIYLQNADGTLSEPTSPETISAADCALLWVEIDDPGSAPAQLISKDCQIDLPDFESFKEGTDRFVSPDLARDLMDVVEQFWRIDDEVQNNSDLITASLDIQLNVTMKRLTTIATIFMPLTFLVGLYGINFRNMPELTWRFGYLFAWTTIIVVAVAMTIIAKKKGWF